MRTWSLLLGLAACGPIYSDPPAPPAAPASGPAAAAPAPAPGGPPGATEPPPAAAPAAPAAVAPAPAPAPPADEPGAGAPSDPYARELPAAPGPSRAPSPAIPAAMRSLVDEHNRVRARHCAPPLRWSPELARFAQRWADTLRSQGCKFGHSGGRYGENLAAGTSGTLDGRAVTAMWYDEIKLYRFPNGGFSMETGHFTQVVWRGSTQIGCATTTCRGMDIWVCEYDPPGNFQGQFRENVQPARCK